MLFFFVQILPIRSGICSGTVSGGIPLLNPRDALPKQKVRHVPEWIPDLIYAAPTLFKKTARVTAKENNVWNEYRYCYL